MKVPIKQISQVQKALIDSLIVIPKFKVVKGIEGDDARKCVLLRADAKEKVDAYALEQGFETTEETISLGYDNLTMSNHLSNLMNYRRGS